MIFLLIQGLVDSIINRIEISNPMNRLININFNDISNEETNIVIGKIIDYSFFNENSKPFLVVFDYISNTKLTLMSVVKEYNKDLVNAIMKMTPQERHIVFYGSNKSFAQKEPVIQDINELNLLLEKNNFFKDFKN